MKLSLPAPRAAVGGSHAADAVASTEGEVSAAKKRMRGRNKARLKVLRKKANVIDQNREDLKARLEREFEAERKAREGGAAAVERAPATALDRFTRKKKE